MKMMKFASSMLAAFAYAANQDGVWSDHDWYDEEQGIGVNNGVPYGLEPDVQRRIDSAML